MGKMGNRRERKGKRELWVHSSHPFPLDKHAPESTLEKQNDSQIHQKANDGQQTPSFAADQSSDGAGNATEHETAAYKEQRKEDEEAGVTVERIAKVRVFREEQPEGRAECGKKNRDRAQDRTRGCDGLVHLRLERRFEKLDVFDPGLADAFDDEVQFNQVRFLSFLEEEWDFVRGPIGGGANGLVEAL